MKTFVLTISDEAVKQIRELLKNQDFDTEGLPDSLVIQELFYVNDRGRLDLDVRHEVTLEPT